MDFFISAAYAQGGAPGGGGGIEQFIFLIALFAVFYFLLIRPQQKRAKEHKKLVAELEKGDEIVTNGGLLGRIAKVGDHFLHLEVADNLRVRVQRQAVASVVPKGTMKDA